MGGGERGLGIAKMAAWARRFHLGTLTGIDLPFEIAEPFPSPATIRPWYQGNTVNTAIGQGHVLVTPMQIAVAMAAIANGGTLYEPHVAAGVIQSSSPRLQIDALRPKVSGVIEASPRTWKMVRQGLWEVVNTQNGTGRRCRIEGFTTMGKTGTAEKPPYAPHAWYACFGPVDGDNVPEIVVLVMLEHGGHGGEAASPLAKELLEFYLSGGRETIA
jgi:penicillin-binding protein 2